MKLLVNIECPLGLKTPEYYISIISERLGVDKKDEWLCDDSGESWYWILSNVDRNLYLSEYDNISMEFLSLIEKGLVRYFYIGKAETNLQNAKLVSNVFNAH